MPSGSPRGRSGPSGARKAAAPSTAPRSTGRSRPSRRRSRACTGSSFWTRPGIPCGPINTIDQVFADPQVEHLGLARPVTHPRLGAQRLVGTPINLEGVANQIRQPTPETGQHGAEILAQLGYDADAIAGLRAKGVI